MKRILVALLAVIALFVTVSCSNDKGGKDAASKADQTIACAQQVASSIEDEDVKGVVNAMQKLDDLLGEMSDDDKKAFALWLGSEEGEKFGNAFSNADPSFTEKVRHYREKHHISFDNVNSFDPSEYLDDEEDEEEEIQGHDYVEIYQRCLDAMIEAMEDNNPKKLVLAAVKSQKALDYMSNEDVERLADWTQSREGSRTFRLMESAAGSLDNEFVNRAVRYAERKDIDLYDVVPYLPELEAEEDVPAPPVPARVTPEVLEVVEEEAPTAVIGPAEGPVNNTASANDNTIYLSVDQMASYPGGEQACYEWLGRNVRYPARCQEEGVQGRVMVKFVVEKDGSIGDVQILRSPDEDLSKEAMRVVKAMPKWSAARKDGQPVRSYFTLPIMFRLN